jgi:hypothetical protein
MLASEELPQFHRDQRCDPEWASRCMGSCNSARTLVRFAVCDPAPGTAEVPGFAHAAWRA